MTLQTVTRIVRTTAITGLITAVAAFALAAFESHGDRNALLTTAANVVMVLTLAIQATFLVVQLFPNGRASVPLFTSTDDGWLFAIVITAAAGVMWDNLGRLAGPPMSESLPRHLGPIFNCVLLALARTYQLHNRARGDGLHQG